MLRFILCALFVLSFSLAQAQSYSQCRSLFSVEHEVLWVSTFFELRQYLLQKGFHVRVQKSGTQLLHVFSKTYDGRYPSEIHLRYNPKKNFFTKSELLGLSQVIHNGGWISLNND